MHDSQNIWEQPSVTGFVMLSKQIEQDGFPNSATSSGVECLPNGLMMGGS